MTSGVPCDVMYALVLAVVVAVAAESAAAGLLGPGVVGGWLAPRNCIL